MLAVSFSTKPQSCWEVNKVDLISLWNALVEAVKALVQSVLRFFGVG